MIVHRLMMIIFYSRQPDTPEDNADPVGDTTTKGCYSGGSTLYSSYHQVAIRPKGSLLEWISSPV